MVDRAPTGPAASECADVAEALRAVVAGLALGLPVALLGGLAATKARGWWTDGFIDYSQTNAGFWTESLWSIVLVLVAIQLVTVLLVCEHLIQHSWLQWVVVWVVRVLVARL